MSITRGRTSFRILQCWCASRGACQLRELWTCLVERPSGENLVKPTPAKEKSKSLLHTLEMML